MDLIGCWSRGEGEGRPRLRSSSLLPLVVVPLSSEGNSGSPPVNTSSRSRSVRGKKGLLKGDFQEVKLDQNVPT